MLFAVPFTRTYFLPNGCFVFVYIPEDKEADTISRVLYDGGQIYRRMSSRAFASETKKKGEKKIKITAFLRASRARTKNY